MTSTEEVSVMLQHYREHLNWRLNIRKKTRIELPPETFTVCQSLFTYNRIASHTLLSEVKDWQDKIRTELERYIGLLISEIFGHDCFRPGRFPKPYDVYLPFIPAELDKIRPLKEAGTDPAYQGQMLDFVFLNVPFEDPFRNKELGLHLLVGMKPVKPAWNDLREIVYEKAKQNRALFNLANSKGVGKAKNCTILTHKLLSREECIRLNIEEVKALLKSRLVRFKAQQYPPILSMLTADDIQDFRPS